MNLDLIKRLTAGEVAREAAGVVGEAGGGDAGITDPGSELQDPGPQDQGGEDNPPQAGEGGEEPLQGDKDQQEPPQGATGDEGDQGQQDGEPSGIEKALRDTKAWATRVAQENAQLRKRLEAIQKGEVLGLTMDPAIQQKLAQAKKLTEEFEEAKPLVELLETVLQGVARYETQARQGALMAQVAATHPDAPDIVQDPTFHAWVQQQPPAVQFALVHSNDPRDAIWAIGLYKKEIEAQRTAEERRRLEAAKKARAKATGTPRSGRQQPAARKRWTRAEIARLSLEEYRKHEAEIEAALARGEID